MINNKKGGVAFDIFLGGAIVFFTIFIMIISYTIWINWNAEIQSLDIGDAITKQRINDMGNWFFLLDKAIPFIFLVFWAATIMSSILVKPEHPFFFLVSLFVVGFLTISSFVFVDWGTTLFQNELLLSASTALSNGSFFVNNFHWISFLVMLFSVTWFYTKDNFALNLGRGIER